MNGIILAAGMSSRMNAFKPLLLIKDKTIIEHSIDCMLEAGVDQLVIVLGHRADEIKELVRKNYSTDKQRKLGVQITFAHNSNFRETDMLTSVKIGISALSHCDCFYLLPGDMPAISGSTFLAVKKAMEASEAMVVFPEWNGRQKHPPLISYDCRKLILEYDGNEGLRGLWKQLEGQLLTVPVDDPGCLLDADTADDYDKLKQYMEK